MQTAAAVLIRTSIITRHLARLFEGRNSAYNVTLSTLIRSIKTSFLLLKSVRNEMNNVELQMPIQMLRKFF